MKTFVNIVVVVVIGVMLGVILFALVGCTSSGNTQPPAVILSPDQHPGLPSYQLGH